MFGLDTLIVGKQRSRINLNVPDIKRALQANGNLEKNLTLPNILVLMHPACGNTPDQVDPKKKESPMTDVL